MRIGPEDLSAPANFPHPKTPPGGLWPAQCAVMGWGDRCMILGPRAEDHEEEIQNRLVDCVYPGPSDLLGDVGSCPAQNQRRSLSWAPQSLPFMPPPCLCSRVSVLSCTCVWVGVTVTGCKQIWGNKFSSIKGFLQNKITHRNPIDRSAEAAWAGWAVDGEQDPTQRPQHWHPCYLLAARQPPAKHEPEKWGGEGDGAPSGVQSGCSDSRPCPQDFRCHIVMYSCHSGPVSY